MQISMNSFEERLGARARRARQPLSCLFEITPRCNLRCKFCYVALDPYQGPYLTTEQTCRVLDTIERAGVLWLTLTGGEIFSRRDFREIYEHALDCGFLVTLYTNATMVSDATAALLAERPPFSVEVSIYGADAERYESTTQIPGSFARFERGVERLRGAGVSLLMKCPVSTLTADHVEALVRWCTDRGLPFKADPVIDARHDGGQEPTLYRIEPRRVVALRDELYELRHGQPRPAGPLAECSVRDEDGRSDETRSVQQRPVDAAAVADHPLALFEQDLGMAARQELVAYWYRAVRRAAECDRARRHGDLHRSGVRLEHRELHGLGGLGHAG